MVQKATVVKIVNAERAIVLVPRASSCTGECEKCGGCSSLVKSIETAVLNPVGAKVGDVVVLESDTRQILSMMLLVFVCPIIGVILFYILASLFSESEAVRALIAFLGLLFGWIGAFMYNRKLTRKDVLVVSIVKIENSDVRYKS